jgi:pyridoxine 4-dehydrogenase
MTSHEQRYRLGPVTVSRTAQFYGPGVANELIRTALHPYPEGLALVSKVGARRDLSGRVLRFDSPAQLTQGIEDTVRVLPLQGRPGRRR